MHAKGVLCAQPHNARLPCCHSPAREALLNQLQLRLPHSRRRIHPVAAVTPDCSNTCVATMMLLAAQLCCQAVDCCCEPVSLLPQVKQRIDIKQTQPPRLLLLGRCSCCRCCCCRRSCACCC
jgi:hypothetical protein